MATAAVSDLKERVNDIITCPVCLEDYDNPRSLPCLHTFCLKCIEDYAGRYKSPDDSGLACPVCRENFTLGDKGVAGLPNNFFIVDLLDAKNVSKDGSGEVLCEICSSENTSTTEVIHATVYCVDCGQNMCDRCSLPHKKWKGGGHQIVSIEELKSSERSKVTRSASSYCEKDPDELVKMYCLDCQTNICIVCFATSHQQHQCHKIELAAEKMGREIDDDIFQVSPKAAEIQTKLDDIDQLISKFNKQVQEIEIMVQERAKEMKQVIDKEMNQLFKQLEFVQHTVMKDVSSLRESLDMALVAVDSFTTYSQQLRSKGKPCDISKAALGLHKRAMELQKMSIASVDNCIPNVIFTPVNIGMNSKTFATEQNLIGDLVVTRYSAVSRVEHVLPAGEPVWGVTSLDSSQLCVLRSRAADRVELYSIPDFVRQSHVPIPKLRGLADMTSSSRDRCVYVVDCVARNVHRVETQSGSSSTWPVDDDPWGISVTSSLDDQVLVTCDEASKLKIFSPFGQLIRQLLLCPAVMNPCHAVQTLDGQFVVCHGADPDTSHSVCLVSSDGSLVTSYTGDSGGQTTAAAAAGVSRMSKPCHVAVDADGLVFVADMVTDSVLMLSPRLGFISDVATASVGASGGSSLRWKPWRLCIDSRRLYVADNEFVDGKWTAGRVVVFQL